MLDCGNKQLDLSRTQVMGILNVTPDSFFDGGRFYDVSSALFQARRMVAEGATIIDVGGESTRPGAQAVSLQCEMDRVLPVVEALSKELPVVISIDTHKSELMRLGVASGAGFINDVRGLQGQGALTAAAELGVPVCVMHMQGEPTSMQSSPEYEDVVGSVYQFFQERILTCERAGIPRDRVILDPGFGFGKTLRHNLALMNSLSRFRDLGCEILVGVSRKSMIGKVLDKPVNQRLYGSIALASLAAWQGASIIRVHDVGATVDAVKMIEAVRHLDG